MARIAALLLIGLVASGCLLDSGARAVVENPCDTAVEVRFVEIPLGADPSGRFGEIRSISSGGSGSISTVPSGDMVIVMLAADLGWEERWELPKRGETRVFRIDPSLCPGSGS